MRLELGPVDRRRRRLQQLPEAFLFFGDAFGGLAVKLALELEVLEQGFADFGFPGKKVVHLDLDRVPGVVNLALDLRQLAL